MAPRNRRVLPLRTRVFVFFHSQDLPWASIDELFRRAGRLDLSAAGPSPVHNYSPTFWDDDARLAVFRQELVSAGLEWSERQERVFAAREIEQAPLLWMFLKTAERGFGGPRYGTRYDLSSACPQCGTGAIQVSPLRLNPSEIGRVRDVFQTLDHEYLISAPLAKALGEASLTGLDLRQAQSSVDSTDLSWFQLVAKNELPPLSSRTKGLIRENPCTGCGRDGYYNTVREPTALVYEFKDVETEGLPDASHTYEHFGKSVLREPFSESHLAAPLLIVKPSVYRAFRAQRVRGLSFEPVMIAPRTNAEGKRLS
jgi:hypothetical protein